MKKDQKNKTNSVERRMMMLEEAIRTVTLAKQLIEQRSAQR